MGAQGDKTIEPTTANYTFKHIMEEQNTTYEIDLGPTQLREVKFPPLCLQHLVLVSDQVLLVDLTMKVVHAIHAACSMHLASICHRDLMLDAQAVAQFNVSSMCHAGLLEGCYLQSHACAPDRLQPDCSQGSSLLEQLQRAWTMRQQWCLPL